MNSKQISAAVGFAMIFLVLAYAQMQEIRRSSGSGGPGGSGTAMTFGAYGAGDSIPVDGSITTQAAWNTDTGHVYWNTAWPDTASPTWEAH